MYVFSSPGYACSCLVILFVYFFVLMAAILLWSMGDSERFACRHPEREHRIPWYQNSQCPLGTRADWDHGGWSMVHQSPHYSCPRLRGGKVRVMWIGRSSVSTWKYQFLYDHWSQAMLSSVSTWMGDCFKCCLKVAANSLSRIDLISRSLLVSWQCW